MSKYTEAVARGIQFLDKRTSDSACDCGCGGVWTKAAVSSDWREKVAANADNLNLDSASNCILGTIYGDYFRGLNKLGLSESDARRYGYLADSGDNGKELTAEWADQLNLTEWKVGSFYLEKGDNVYGVKIIDIVDVRDPKTEETVRAYAALASKVLDGKIVPLGVADLSGLYLRSAEDMRRGFNPEPYVPKFVPSKGMFVTNNNGRVWYYNGKDYYPTDGGIPLFSIDKNGLREVTLQDGRKFREIVEG